MPVVLLNPSSIEENLRNTAESISQTILSLSEQDINPANRDNFRKFQEHICLLKDTNVLEDKLIIPLGYDNNNNPSLSIFGENKIKEKIFSNYDSIDNEQVTAVMSALLYEIRSTFDYIYIPKDIAPKDLTKLETGEIQALMGQNLT